MLKTVPPISQPNSHISGLKYGEKLFITYLGIIQVNLQGGWFSPIHQEIWSLLIGAVDTIFHGKSLVAGKIAHQSDKNKPI